MAHLSRDDILKLASLSKLELTDDQVSRFTRELESLVSYIEQLQAVNVDGLEPTDQVTGLNNVMRPDEIRKYADPDSLLKNAPALKSGHIKVKRMID